MVQNLIASACVYAASKTLVPRLSAVGFGLILGGLGLLTPLALYSNFLMPSLYGGLFILAAIMVATCEPGRERRMWFAMG